jgi:hypothetical protein
MTELILVPDEEHQRPAEAKGASSAQAQVLARLTTQRAQDLQAYAFRRVISTSPEIAIHPTPSTNSTR